MANNKKWLSGLGLALGGIALLLTVDFLNARVFAPISPFYKKRGDVTKPQPNTAELDLSNVKLSDLQNELEKQKPKSAPLAHPSNTEIKKPQTLNLGQKKGLAEGWQKRVLAKRNKKPDASAADLQGSDLASKKAVEYLTGRRKDSDILSDPELTKDDRLLILSLLPMKRLEALAKAGSPMAQNQLGLKYYNDKKNAKAAHEWFMKAAKGGREIALTNAVAMLESQDISTDKKLETVKYVRAQADKGRAAAQEALGQFYRKGLYGVPKDLDTAFFWIEKAANDGNAQAQYKLGFAKKIGIDIPKDKEGAVEWLRKSARQGNMNGQYWLGEAYKDGDGVIKSEAIAAEWFKLAYKSGYKSAALQLLFLYYNPESRLHNYDKARKWAEQMVADNNSAVGHGYIAEMYALGRGYPKSDERAFEHYQIAAKGKYSKAQYELALMYLEGRGHAPDREKAIALLKKAANNYSFEADKKLKELGETP